MTRTILPKPTRPTTAALLALLLITAACGWGSRGDGGDFRIVAYQPGGVLEGTETTLGAVLAQGKPVVLNFWAGDCPPCIEEMPVLEAAWQEHRGEIVMLGVDIGPLVGLGTFESGVRLLHESKITYPAGNSLDPGILHDFGVSGLPATFFILPDGEITDRWPGAIRPDDLNSRILELIERTGGSHTE